MQTLNPSAVCEQVLRSGKVPGLCRDAMELELDVVIQPATDGMRNLAPWGRDNVKFLSPSLMRWSPETCFLIYWELQMIRKSSSW
jgi:hypothetical protein